MTSVFLPHGEPTNRGFAIRENRVEVHLSLPIPDRRRILIGLALAALVIFPLSPLLQLRAHFGGDYDIAFWIAGYVAKYMQIYHHPPNVFQTATYLGIAYPAFYGVLLYRVLGLIAAVSSTDIAFRVVIFAAYTAQALTTYRAARVLRAGPGIALLLCGGVELSTYQLTNLYNRGDLAEFIAVTQLDTALAAWFWSLGARTPLERNLARAIIAAALTFMCGTHAITLALGGLLFFAVAGLTALAARRRTTLVTLGIAALSFVCGAAILAIDYALIARNIHFYPGKYAFGFSLFPDRIDAPFARFSPFPLDPQTLAQGTIRVSTAYLEASIDYALLLFALGVSLRRRNPLALGFAAAALILAGISVWPWFWDVAPAPLHFMQFPYRLTSYENALSLCAAFVVVWRLPHQTRATARTPLPWVAATIALIACTIKLNHAITPFHQVADTPIDFTLTGSLTLVATAYTIVPQAGPPVPPHAPPPEVSFFAVGAPMPQHYVADRHGYVFTRILALPWNDIIVDGQVLPAARKLAWKDSPFYAFRTRPRSAHAVQTTLLLPTIVDRIIRLAEYAFGLELLAVVVLLVMLFARSGRIGRPDLMRSVRA